MRSGTEITEAIAILAAFEQANAGLKTQLTLYTDGEGAIIVQNNRLETVDGIDFTENASLTDIAHRVVERAAAHT